MGKDCGADCSGEIEGRLSCVLKGGVVSVAGKASEWKGKGARGVKAVGSHRGDGFVESGEAVGDDWMGVCECREDAEKGEEGEEEGWHLCRACVVCNEEGGECKVS